jgi:hypothetical protein
MIREGDVLLVPVEAVPEQALPPSPAGCGAVFVHGEATGRRTPLSRSGEDVRCHDRRR